jgi:nucleotide-binding universal stress UspA family protein
MKRFLVCLDASPRATSVLEAAADLAKRSNAQLLLLRTVGLPAEIDQEFYVHAPASMTEILVQKATSDLSSLAEGLPQGLVEAQIVHVGTPWDSICREAKGRNVDLVVIGSHGHSTLDRLLGTTASKVVSHCDRSVLVVRPRPES